MKQVFDAFEIAHIHATWASSVVKTVYSAWFQRAADANMQAVRFGLIFQTSY